MSDPPRSTSGEFWADAEGDQAIRRYQTLLNTVDDGVYQLDVDGRFTAVNEVIVELTGYAREELLGEHVSIVLDEDDCRRIEREIETRVATGNRGVETFEMPAHTADGEAVPCELRLNVLFEDDEFEGTVGIVRDVRERKRAEEIVQERERRRERERRLEQYRALTEVASDVIVTIDETSRIQSVNPAVREVFGYEPAALVGESLTTLMPDELAEPHRESLRRYLETGERTLNWDYVELPGLHADGSEIPLAISFNEVEYQGDSYLTGIVRDITERKQREAERAEMIRELRESEERLQLALQAGEMGTWELDLQTEESTIRSPQHDRIFGYEEPREDWDFETFLDHVHPEDRADVERSFEEGFETGNWEFECRITRDDDGKQRAIAGQGEFHFEDGEAVRAIGVIQDITERKEYQRRLEASNERLEQFAYAASHDLQEPLRMISSYLQLIENRYGERLDEDGEEFLAYAVDGAERMREMIAGLLEYSRVETRGDPFEPVDLNDVLDDVMTDLQLQIEEHDAEIAAEELPRVKGDASQLHQVFQNLLDNAIEYSGDAPPRISVSAERDGGEWRISVRDRGIGIDPDDTDRVFEVFQRLHSHEEHDGTGIGLALCKRIVERHDGDIRVESTPGERTTFSFTLPAASTPGP